MRQRTILFIVLAAVFGFGTFMFARSWVSRERTQVVPTTAAVVEKPATSILVAAHDLATGSFVRPEDLRWQVWPDGQIADSYLLKGKDTPESMAGAVVRQHIATGEPITGSRVIKPGDRGFLAAVLTPGMRAIAVPVTPISGVAGLIFPGDHVDIILSHQVKLKNGDDGATAFASETVQTDIRVLAIDQSTADVEGKPVLAKTVTFEATPKQVEAIEVASTLGNLYLSLRGVAGSAPNSEETTASDEGKGTPGVRSSSYTWDSDVSPLIHHDAGDNGPAVTVLRGTRGGGSGSTINVSIPAMTINGAQVPAAPATPGAPSHNTAATYSPAGTP